jgi:hypothetical protein
LILALFLLIPRPKPVFPEGIIIDSDYDKFVLQTASSEINFIGMDRVFIKISNLEELSNSIKKKSIVIADISDIIGKDPLYIVVNYLKNIIKQSSSIQIIIINKMGNSEAMKDFYDVWLKSLSAINYKPNIFLIDDKQEIYDKKYEALKLDQRLFASQIVAFSYNPYGIAVVEKISDTNKDIFYVINSFIETPHLMLYSSTPITQKEKFSFIGYIFWKSNPTYDWFGGKAGEMFAKVEYYYAEERANSGQLYKFYLAYVMHIVKGYSVNLWDRPPTEMITRTDWSTYHFPGQVLWDWGPKNVFSSDIIEYSVSVNPMATITVVYGSPYPFESFDQSDPQKGIAQVKHVIHNPSPNMFYTVKPSSIGMLDPNKPSGFEPVLVKHYMWTTFNGVDTSISFRVAVYSTSISEN